MNKTTNKEKVWFKNSITWLSIFGVVLLLAAIVGPQWLFYNKLSQYGWSTDPARWGQYGDFIGGLSNPLLAAINIGVFIYLTHRISKLEEDRNKASLNTQHTIALNQFRHDAYNKLKDYFDEFPKTKETSFSDIATAYYDFSRYVKDFNKYNGYLFSGISYEYTITQLKHRLFDIGEMAQQFDERNLDYIILLTKLSNNNPEGDELRKLFKLRLGISKYENDLTFVLQNTILNKPDKGIGNLPSHKLERFLAGATLTRNSNE